MAAALLSTLGMAAPAPLAADEPDSVDTIADIAPDVLDDTAPPEAVTTSPDGQSVRIKDIVVTLPPDASDPVRIDSGALDVQVDLPFSDQAADAELSEEEIPQYDNANGSTTVPVVKDDGSVQFTTVIQDRTSPESFSYVVQLPADAALQPQEDGTVVIAAQDGTFLGGFTKPWARDSAGLDIPTRYEVDGSVLTQIVDHRGADGLTYPVVADPWLGRDLMNTPYLTFPSRGYVVNVVPTSWGRFWSGTPHHAAQVDELRSKLGNRAYRLTYTIREQFVCHVAGNLVELNTYNMESWRPGVRWYDQLNPAVRCNP